jgi:uncharacterized MAPEG superfamily protein
MTPDLLYLALTAGLCAVLWVPYILARVSRGISPDLYTDAPKDGDKAWERRTYRAHINLVENLPVFASLVLVAHVSDQNNDLTAQAAMVFFWARVAHAVVYIAGWPYVRTLAFFVSWLALAVLFWQVVF